VVRDSPDHDEAVCDDNGENWMCRNCYDVKQEEEKKQKCEHLWECGCGKSVCDECIRMEEEDEDGDLCEE
jgi:hypothetical protein